MNCIYKRYKILSSELDIAISSIKEDIMIHVEKLKDENLSPEQHEMICCQIENYYQMISDLEEAKKQYKEDETIN